MIGPDLWNGTVGANDIACLSASTIKSAMASPTLESWTLWETARRTVAELPMLSELAATQPELAKKWIVDSRWTGQRGQLSAADGGTLIHLVAEHWLKGLPAPDVPQYLWPEIRQLTKWFEAFQPELIAAELACFNVNDCVAGRFDAAARFVLRDHELGSSDVLVDFKGHPTASGWDAKGKAKPCYVDHHGVQLSVYANATHYMTWEPRVCSAVGSKGRLYLVSPEELAIAEPMIHFDGAVVVDVWKDRVAMSVVDVGPAVYQRALAARDVWWWLNAESDPVTPIWQGQA